MFTLLSNSIIFNNYNAAVSPSDDGGTNILRMKLLTLKVKQF